MINFTYPKTMALLIDADNTQPQFIEQILELSDWFGKLSVKEAYGNWENSKLSKYRNTFEKLEISCISVAGKNAADGRIFVRIGELLSNDESFIDVFIIVSGDGDFESPCEYIREKDKSLIIIGGKEQTSTRLRTLDNNFYYLEELDAVLKKFQEEYPIPSVVVREVFSLLYVAYNELVKLYNWEDYAIFETILLKNMPYFAENYERYKLADYLKYLEDKFEYNGQSIRRIDHNPELTRTSFLHTAYKRAKQKQGSEAVPIALLGSYLHELTNEYGADVYATYFGKKKLSEWLNSYPEKFKLHQTYVSRA